MKLALAAVAFAFTVSLLHADDKTDAKILAVKAYDQGRIAYWEGHVPIYDGYPFYDLTLDVGGRKYIVRYNTVTGYYPTRWKAGNEIKVRAKGKGEFYLENGNDEVAVEIVRGAAAECVLPNAPPVMLTAGGQVPCE